MKLPGHWGLNAKLTAAFTGLVVFASERAFGQGWLEQLANVLLASTTLAWFTGWLACSVGGAPGEGERAIELDPELPEPRRQLPAEGVAQAARAIAGATQISEICQSLICHFNDLVQAEGTAIYLVDHAQRRVWFESTHGTIEDSNSGGMSYEELEAGIAGQVWQSGRTILSPDPDDGVEPEATKERRKRTGVGAVVVAPLIMRGVVIGTVGTLRRADQAPFDRHDVEMLTMLAAQASTAIENVHLLEESMRANQELERWTQTLEQRVRERTMALQATLQQTEGLYQAAWAIAGATQIKEICHNLISHFHHLVQADHTFIDLVDHTTREVVLGIGYEGGVEVPRQRTYKELAQGMAGMVWQTGQPILSLDADDGIEPEVTRPRRKALGIGALILAPLKIKDETVGCVGTARRVDQPAFTSHDRELLMMLAAQASTAIENVRLLEETMRANQALEELNRTLEQRVAERTLENVQLLEEARAARAAAESANQAKSTFLATMSHEIRTPMNAVIGMTELLRNTTLSREQQGYVDTIRTSGDALLTIIADILDFSKIEAGRFTLEPAPFNIRECLETALDLVATKATEQGLELAYMLDPMLPSSFVGDAARLRQILVNLLTNAVKFTEQGEVVILVAGERREPCHYELHFIVRDTGIGISPEQQYRLFQSFGQLDTSTTRRYGGTGLGLAISKRLSELMGGRLWVESAGIAGEGTRFHFTIMVEEAPNVRVELPSSHILLRGKRLLIVEGHLITRRLLFQLAQSWGMLIAATSSAEEALDWVRRGDPFDAALLAVGQPELDGLELATKIQRERPQSLPLILLTPMGWRGHSRRQFELAALLTKPIKAAACYDTLVGLFGIHTPQDQPYQIGGQEGAALSPLKILIAEDNIVNQKLVLGFLELLGYQGEVVRNGLEVLAAVQGQAYDVILMDVQMPEMDGLEATRQIRQQGAGRQRPWIIAVTANAMQEDRERCLAAGMNDYLSKPVKMEALAGALKRAGAGREQVVKGLHENQGRGRGSIMGGSAAGGSQAPRIGLPATSMLAGLSGATVGGTLRSQHALSLERLFETEEEAPIVPLLDRTVLAELHEVLGMEAATLIEELITLFCESTPALLDELQQAVRRGDRETIVRVAHTLKANSASLGAMLLAAACKEAESLGQSGFLETAEMLLVRLRKEYDQAKAALLEYVGQRVP
jgi:signal transduction histidine kinase/CheY-like chemotaxis protein